MQFLAPMMLIGAAAVSIPIGLHFFYRARYKPLPWAPMKFLKEAIEQTSRRLKFQEWILLALRCLALLLLAFALARPGFRSATVGGRGEAIDAVFVFDTSYSMGASDGENKTRLDRAKDAALAVIDTLPSNSSIQIYGCADRAYLLGPLSRFNMDHARQLIKTIEPTALSTDLLPGLTEALAAAKAGNAAAKEIYVFTDVQKTGFERQQAPIKAKCEEIRDVANLVFIRCAQAERKIGNVAITNVAVSLVSDIPHTRSRVPFVVTLKNTGTQTVKGLKLGLELDGRALEKDAIAIEQIEAGQVYTATVSGSLDEPGPRILKVELTGDDLPGDNVLYRMIYVRDKVRVLIVDGTPNPDSPLESGDHYVRNALNPNAAGDYYIEYDSVPASEVAPRHLENKDVVYVLNAAIREGDPLEGMSSEFLGKLGEFVRGGGGLIIAGGDKVNIPQYNKVLGQKGAGLLPYDLAGVLKTTEESPFAPAPESVPEASWLNEFRKSPYSDVFRFVTINEMLAVNEDDSASQVLARTTINRALLVSKRVGEGEVVMLTTSMDESWGKFPSDGRAFVPFTRFALLHLTGLRMAGGGNAAAGDPLVWNSSDPATVYELVKPPRPGERIRPRVQVNAPEPKPGEKRVVTATDTLQAGIYNIVPAGLADDAGPAYAVNPDLRETEDLATASDSDVAAWLGYQPPIIQAGLGTAAAASQVRSRSEWTVYVLFFVLLILLAETGWAWVCGRAW